MTALSHRFIKLLVAAIVLASIGAAHRAWQRREVVKNIETAETGGASAAGPEQTLQAEAERLKQQLEEMKHQLAMLPQDHRDILQDALAVSNPQSIANPMIVQLSRMHLTPAPNGAEQESTLEQIQRIYLRWRQLETALEALLWIAAAGILIFGLFGLTSQSQNHLSSAHSAAIWAAHAWLMTLFAVNTLSFLASGFNPWIEMPLSFYMAPTLMLGSGVLFGLALHRETPILSNVTNALSAPAASFIVLLMFGWFS